MSLKYSIPSYAKINLFLHITGKRKDNYHDLQTIFQLVNLKDTLQFTVRDDNKILLSSNQYICNQEDNIVYKAAMLIRQYAYQPSGLNIHIDKNIPQGSGLGGGSSNCASTLLMLNRLWQCNLTKIQLIKLGAKLGADVPIFIYGKTAWAEGIGDILYPYEYDDQCVLLIFPKININTKSLFKDPKLKINHVKIKPENFKIEETHNAFENIVRNQYSTINNIFKNTCKTVTTRLTGTGSCVYCLSKNEKKLKNITKKIDKELDTIVTKTVKFCPVDQMIEQITDE